LPSGDLVRRVVPHAGAAIFWARREAHDGWSIYNFQFLPTNLRDDPFNCVAHEISAFNRCRRRHRSPPGRRDLLSNRLANGHPRWSTGTGTNSSRIGARL